MKSSFHFDLHANYMTETNHIIQAINRRQKTSQCHNSRHYENIPAIQETYIQYMQNYWLLEAFCMSHHCQLWLTCPSQHQSDSHLSDGDGAAWENVLHENLAGRKQKAERKKEKGNHIYFWNFSSHPTQGWTPLPISSKSSLYQPRFSSFSQFSTPAPLGSSNLFPQASPNNTHWQLSKTFHSSLKFSPESPPSYIYLSRLPVFQPPSPVCDTSAATEQTTLPPSLCAWYRGFNPTRQTSWGAHATGEKLLSVQKHSQGTSAPGTKCQYS